MNATVAWGYQLLDPAEQRAFRRFGALPGNFSIDAAANVLAGGEAGLCRDDDVLRLVASLINKSLLLRADTSVGTTCPLYCMLETVRAYAARELAASGERDAALEGLVRYAIHEASLAAEGLVGPLQVEWLDRVREGLESYRSAMAWLIDHGRTTDASDIAWNLMFFWFIRGHAAEGLYWYELVLNQSSPASSTESRAVLGAAVMLFAQGEYGRARTELRRALTLAEEADDLNIVAQAEHLSGHVEYAVGNMTTARDRFMSSVDGFRALGIPWGIGHALSGLAAVELATGDADKAEQLLEEAASVLQEVGPWFLSLGLYVRAVLAIRRGHPDQTIAFVRESLSRIRDLHDKFAAKRLVPLAAAAALKGNHAWAARILGARDAAIERTGIATVDTPVDDLQEQAERGARAHLGPDRWAQAYAAGRKTSLDSLLREIDRGT